MGETQLCMPRSPSRRHAGSAGRPMRSSGSTRRRSRRQRRRHRADPCTIDLTVHPDGRVVVGVLGRIDRVRLAGPGRSAAPAGHAIDAATGTLPWTPASPSSVTFDVISRPPDTSAVGSLAPTIVRDLTIRDLPGTFPDVQQFSPSNGVVPGLVNPQLGLLQVDDGPASLATPVLIADAAGTGTDSQSTSGYDSRIGPYTVESYTEVGSGWADDAGSHNGPQRLAGGGAGANSATWQANDLPAGHYTVEASWGAGSGLASDARYQIYDGDTLVEAVTADQSQAPSGATAADGTHFQVLATTVAIASGSIRVVLSNAADGLVAAGTVRVTEEAPTDLGWSGVGITVPSADVAGPSFTADRRYSFTSGMLAIAPTTMLTRL